MIRSVTDAAGYAAFGAMCREYVAECRARYDDMPWFFDGVFGHQSLDEELGALPIKYGPPEGRALVAVTADGGVSGGGAWRRCSDSICELKRLYVSDSARGFGLGRHLTEALMASARSDGFETMRLDTADRLTEAIAMYGAMGFARVAPYHDYPTRLARHLIFMERAL